MEKRRVFMLCLFALSMILSAWALPPDEKKVTLDLKDVPMETFLNRKLESTCFITRRCLKELNR